MRTTNGRLGRMGQIALVGGLIAASLATPGRAEWTAYGGDVEKHFFTNEKLQAPLGVVWKHATMTPAEGPGNMGGPVVSNGIIYFPSKDRLYAVEAETGELLWRAPEGDDNNPNLVQISATPLVAGDRVYVPDGKGGMTAYNAEDGNQVWTFRTGAAIRSSPILVDGRLYFGSDDDSLYAVDAKVGDLIWKSNQGGKDYKLPDDAVGSPVYYNGVIYINSADMKLWAFQAETGRFIWMQRMMAPSLGISPVAFNGRVYMASGNTMYQFRLRGGHFKSFPLHQWVENDITTTPIITEHNWFFGDRNGYFHAFTTAGKPALTEEGTPWKVKLEGRPSGAPVMTPDTLFVATDKGFVYAIDILKGKVIWTYRIEAPKGMPDLKAYYPVRAPLAISGGRLYVLGDDGTLTALSPDAPDDEGPVVAQPKPTRGAVVNGSPPLAISAYLWDEGTGINPDTIELLIDGQPIDPDEKPYNERVVGERKGWTYDPVRRLLTFKTLKGDEKKAQAPMLNGRHKVQITAADWKGNFTSLEWGFVVDNTVPKPQPRPRDNNNNRGGAGGPGGAMGPGGMMGPGGGGMMGPGGGYPSGGGVGGGFPGSNPTRGNSRGNTGRGNSRGNTNRGGRGGTLGGFGQR